MTSAYCDEDGPEKGRHMASAIDVLTFDGAQITEITAFVTPGIFPRFGLPSLLAP